MALPGKRRSKSQIGIIALAELALQLREQNRQLPHFLGLVRGKRSARARSRHGFSTYSGSEVALEFSFINQHILHGRAGAERHMYAFVRLIPIAGCGV